VPQFSSFQISAVHALNDASWICQLADVNAAPFCQYWSKYHCAAGCIGIFLKEGKRREGAFHVDDSDQSLAVA